MNGQNNPRPHTTNAAGSSVIMVTSAAAIPIAPTGPRPRLELSSPRSRQSMLMMTVAAEATIAGPARRIATRIAACVSV